MSRRQRRCITFAIASAWWPCVWWSAGGLAVSLCVFTWLLGTLLFAWELDAPDETRE